MELCKKVGSLIATAAFHATCLLITGTVCTAQVIAAYNDVKDKLDEI